MIGLDQAVRPELCFVRYALPVGDRWRLGLARRRVSTYLVEIMRRHRRLNPYRPATDIGLLKILALVVAAVLIVASGAFDCELQFIHVGFC